MACVTGTGHCILRHCSRFLFTLLASLFYSNYRRSRPPDASVATERLLTVAIAYVQVTSVSGAG